MVLSTDQFHITTSSPLINDEPQRPMPLLQWQNILVLFLTGGLIRYARQLPSIGKLHTHLSFSDIYLFMK